MTKIKLCGLTRICDVEYANSLKPEYVGFVFAPKSRRYVSGTRAAALKERLETDILAVGVFVNENLETAAELLGQGVIDIAQLHGDEDEAYIAKLREITGRPVIRAFRIRNERDVMAAEASCADYVLLDAGAGCGKSFDWKLIENVERPYFLAGGLSADNVEEAVRHLHPYAVDVSSGIETEGYKDREKMAAFVEAARKDVNA